MGIARRVAALGVLMLLASGVVVHAQRLPETTPEAPPSKPKVRRAPRPKPLPPPGSRLAELTLQTLPDAEVYLDDEFRGRPGPEGRLIVRDVNPGPHKLRITSAGRQVFERAVTLAEGEVVTILADLPELLGKLIIQVAPGAEVFLDGQSRGPVDSSGEQTLLDVPPGSHEVRISAARKQDWQHTVRLGAGEALTVSASLIDLPGKVAFHTTPGAEIFLDGVSRGKASSSGELTVSDVPPGSHEARISAEKKQTWAGKVYVGAGETFIVNETLADYFGSLEIVTMPGAQVIMDQHLVGASDSNGTLEVREVEPGKHEVSVVRVGYERWEQSIVMNAGGKVNLEAHLVPASSEFLPDRTLKGHEASVAAVAFSPDDRYVASGGDDRTIRLWELSGGAEGRSLKGHLGPVRSIAFSPDGRYLASGSDDMTVKIWEVASGAEVQMLKGHREPVLALAFSPDGRYLASGSHDETVKLWDTAKWTEIRAIAGNSEPVFALGFSPDNQYLAWASNASTIKVLNIATGEAAKSFSRPARWIRRLPIVPLPSIVPVPNLGLTALPAIRAIAFSPDGRYLASGGFDKSIRIWEVGTGREVRKLEGHGAVVASVAFNPDGRYLASGSHDKTIRVWQVSTWREIHSLAGNTAEVRSVAFSHDGRYLAAASKDKTVRLWRRKGN
jgi:WD40 repeat protein